MSLYQNHIKELAPDHDPRHIEAFMRNAMEENHNGCLDHLSLAAFKAEIEMAILCIKEGGIMFAERCAKSYGL